MSASPNLLAYGWCRLAGKAKEQWMQLTGMGNPSRKACASSNPKSLPAPDSPTSPAT